MMQAGVHIVRYNYLNPSKGLNTQIYLRRNLPAYIIQHSYA